MVTPTTQPGTQSREVAVVECNLSLTARKNVAAFAELYLFGMVQYQARSLPEGHLRHAVTRSPRHIELGRQSNPKSTYATHMPAITNNERHIRQNEPYYCTA